MTSIVTLACKSKKTTKDFQKVEIHLEEGVSPLLIEQAYSELGLIYEAKTSKSSAKYRFRLKHQEGMNDLINKIEMHPKIISVHLMKTKNPTATSGKSGKRGKVKLSNN